MRLSKKFAAIAITATVALTASAAFAYWTTTGSGSGSATVGTASTVSISPVNSASLLVPGGSSAITFTIHNTSLTDVHTGPAVADNSGPDGILGGAGAADDLVNGISGLNAGCSAADFSFVGGETGYTVLANNTAAGTGTLSMSNSAADQNPCKTSPLTLHLKV